MCLCMHAANSINEELYLGTTCMYRGARVHIMCNPVIYYHNMYLVDINFLLLSIKTHICLSMYGSSLGDVVIDAFH